MISRSNILQLAFCTVVYGVVAPLHAQRSRDLNAIVLESGITLHDWLQLPAVKNARDPMTAGSAAARYIRQYGPYRELLDVVRQASEAEALSVNSITLENAQTKVLELQKARAALGDWPAVLTASARAHFLVGNRPAALADLKVWMRVVPASAPERLEIAEVLAAGEMDPTAIDSYFIRQNSSIQELKRVLVRPTLPVPIDESVWATLEQSELYRKSAKARSMSVDLSYTEHQISVENSSPELVKKRETYIPVSERCLRIQILEERTYEGNTSTHSTEHFMCAGVSMWYTSHHSADPSNKYTSTLSKITKIKGSLYPPRVGAEQEVATESTSSSMYAPKSTSSSKCRITERMDARSIDLKLTGNAWKVDCEVRIDTGLIATSKDILLEDLGIQMRGNHIGTGTTQNYPVMAKPDYEYIETSKTKNGSDYIVKTTYNNVSWTAGAK